MTKGILQPKHQDRKPQYRSLIQHYASLKYSNYKIDKLLEIHPHTVRKWRNRSYVIPLKKERKSKFSEEIHERIVELAKDISPEQRKELIAELNNTDLHLIEEKRIFLRKLKMSWLKTKVISIQHFIGKNQERIRK